MVVSARFRIVAVVLALLCFGAGPVRADLVINEILAGNWGYEVEGDDPDLVEIHNTGAESIELRTPDVASNERLGPAVPPG